jgi:hypothetical protein
MCDQLLTAHIKNIEIKTSLSFESNILNFVTKYRNSKYGKKLKFNKSLDSSNLPPVLISERKIRFGIHNSWAFVNTKGLDTSVLLTTVSGSGVYTFKGVIPLENYTEDEAVGFIFEFVYTCKKFS